MKRIVKIISLTIFTIFSFYYTEKVIDLSKKEDSIMQQILDQKSVKEIKPVNGIIGPDTITVGTSGKTIDVEASYESMKKIKKFNENLLEYMNVKPIISKNDNYDKLIIGSSTNNREISIIFVIEDIEVLKQIIYITKKDDIPVTVFMDFKLIKDGNIKDLLTDNVSIGIYGYDNSFDNVSTKYVKGYLSKNFNYSNYCLYKDKNFLKACAYYKINTIKPIIIEKNIYSYLKDSKEKGAIYQIKITRRNISELNTSFIYLKQKGYKIIKIDDLLKE